MAVPTCPSQPSQISVIIGQVTITRYRKRKGDIEMQRRLPIDFDVVCCFGARVRHSGDREIETEEMGRWIRRKEDEDVTVRISPTGRSKGVINGWARISGNVLSVYVSAEGSHRAWICAT